MIPTGLCGLWLTLVVTSEPSVMPSLGSMCHDVPVFPYC